MSATLDTNVLVYACDQASPVHKRALDFVQQLAAGPELLHLFWPVVMGYLRIATHPTIFEQPLSYADAMANIDDLLTRSHIRVTGENDGFWASYTRVTERVAPRGNLVPDAHVVALMRQHGVATVWSRDRDFRKFDGITARDPFK